MFTHLKLGPFTFLYSILFVSDLNEKVQLPNDLRENCILCEHGCPCLCIVGNKVTCGQQIVKVGNKGDSSNPHLHFETRIESSGARFDSMAYYTAQSTQSERYNYIVWRVTNLFQLFDLMALLSIKE